MFFGVFFVFFLVFLWCCLVVVSTVVVFAFVFCFLIGFSIVGFHGDGVFLAGFEAIRYLFRGENVF